MLDWLVALDSSLFLFLNAKLANSLFDVVMPFITNRWTLHVLIAAIFSYLLLFGGRKGRITVLLCLVTFLLSDLINFRVFKQLFHRVRPCHVIDSINLLVHCSQGFAFPSSHAANSFGQAMILSLCYPRLRLAAFGAAIVVGYSRIAVGVHYPFDVVAGAVVGVLCALLTYLLFSRIFKQTRHTLFHKN